MELQPYIAYYPSGKRRHEIWFTDGSQESRIKRTESGMNISRENGPAFTAWYENGNKAIEEWVVNGQYHRIGQPAKLQWYDNGQPKEEYWLENGQWRSHIEGPALVIYSKDGECLEKLWECNGEVDFPLVLIPDEIETITCRALYETNSK